MSFVRPSLTSKARRALRTAVLSLAGIVAQRKHAPRSVRSYHGHDDRRAVLLVAERVGVNDEEEMKHWYRRVLRRTERLLGYKWRALEVLAKALIKKRELSGEETLAVMRSAYELPAAEQRRIQAIVRGRSHAHGYAGRGARQLDSAELTHTESEHISFSRLPDAALADSAFFYSGRQKNSPGGRTLGRESFGTRATDAPRISGSYARRPDCGERAAWSQWFKSTNADSRSVQCRSTRFKPEAAHA
jgi:hypothetical protein